MLQDAIFLIIALLIVMPVIALLLRGLKRTGDFSWKPQWLAVVTVVISLGIILMYDELR